MYIGMDKLDVLGTKQTHKTKVALGRKILKDNTGCFKTRVQISKFDEIFSEGVNSVQQILKVVRGLTFLFLPKNSS